MTTTDIEPKPGPLAQTLGLVPEQRAATVEERVALFQGRDASSRRHSDAELLALTEAATDVYRRRRDADDSDDAEKRSDAWIEWAAALHVVSYERQRCADLDAVGLLTFPHDLDELAGLYERLLARATRELGDEADTDLRRLPIADPSDQRQFRQALHAIVDSREKAEREKREKDADSRSGESDEDNEGQE